MRLCRYEHRGHTSCGFYSEERILPLASVAASLGERLTDTGSLLPFLPGGESRELVQRLEQKLSQLAEAKQAELSLPTDEVQLLVPVGNPNKLLLLAGNYAAHIEEGGSKAEEREKTYPYVFMKPPTTTLTNPDQPVRIPAVSPDHIDWELELAFIIGRRCHAVSEADALKYVAGYTIVNDISDRKYKPNPGRADRPKNQFFDWLHGKWHDTFCPVGPCVLPADEIDDPQTLHMVLRVNGEVEQDASTGDMIFPVAAVIEFISQSVTLEPGDVVATGTPAGVGNAKGKYLKPGDVVEAEIERIGVLRNPVKAG